FEALLGLTSPSRVPNPFLSVVGNRFRRAAGRRARDACRALPLAFTFTPALGRRLRPPLLGQQHPGIDEPPADGQDHGAHGGPRPPPGVPPSRERPSPPRAPSGPRRW